MSEKLTDLQMAAVYLAEIGDQDGLDDMRLELESIAADQPEHAADCQGLLACLQSIA